MDRFTVLPRRARGYDRAQVDAYLARVERNLDRGVPVPADDIRKAGFDLVRGGYAVAEVDGHLDALELRATRAAGPRGGPGGAGDLAAEATALAEVSARPAGERFPRVGPLRRGYATAEVDALLDALAGSLARERPALPPDRVRTAVFRARRGGYDEDAVDDHLDRVVDLLLRRTAASS